MIDNIESRRKVAKSIGQSLNELVKEHHMGLVEEPDITSRIAQRLEDKFNGHFLGGYNIHVITETITSHGPKSLEKPMGTDLYLAFSVKDQLGNQTTKGILIQAKRRTKLKWPELEEQCRRMNMVSKKGSVVWLYDSHGINVIRSPDVSASRSQIDLTTMFERVFACEIGDKRKVPSGSFGNRAKLKEMLSALGAKNAAWLELEKD